jgi:hypothetical protein
MGSAAGARLALFLLLAPALLWLGALIVLPHVELAVLSLRARVAPRVYEWSLAQYATFIEEPLYWHTFVRTAAMSIIATVATLLIAFPVAWYIAKVARGRAKSALFVPVPHSVLGERDGAHLGLDDPAARVGRAAASSRRSRHHRGAGRAPVPRRDRSWSASSTPRCCSWSCRS